MLAHNIADLVQAPSGTTLDLSLDESRPDLTPEVELAAPINGRVRLHRTQIGILAQCQISTAVRLNCSRCLEPMVQPLQTRFEEEFLVDASGPDLGTDTFRLDEHHILDLTEAIRQYLTLAAPLAPLCRADCAGLCPDCGALLANGHECPIDDVPSGPFAALAKLKKTDTSA